MTLRRNKLREGLIALMPDTHVDVHHVKAVNAFLGWLADVRPEQVLNLGDLVDFVSVARWSTGTRDEDGRKLQAEIDATRQFFADMRSAYRGPFSIVAGNHEDRMSKYLRTKAQGLFGLESLSLPELLGMAEFDVTPLEQPHWIAPDVQAIHGIKLGQKAGYSVHKEMDRRGCSVVHGHSHRQALVYRRTDRLTFGMECGHLADQGKAGYLDHGLADWNMGFAVLHVRGDYIQPELVSMKDDGSFLWDGRVFRA